MKIKNKLILSSLAVIAVAGGIAGGSTYALFTSNDSVNIAITSGQVEVSASLSNPTLYSALAKKYYDAMSETTKATINLELDENDNPISNTAEDNNAYYNQKVNDNFTTGGSAELKNGVLSIKEAAPGDKVVSELTIANTSNINIKYRLVAECIDTDEDSLRFYNKLDFTFGSKGMNKSKKYYTDWTEVEVGETIDNINISVQLPITLSNDYQNKTAHIKFSVQAVQANAYTENSQEELLDFQDKKVPAAADTVIEAGKASESSNALVRVVVPTGTTGETKAGEEVVTSGDTLRLSVEEKEDSSITVETNQTVKNYDVSLKTSSGTVVNTVNQTLKVEVYIGTGKDIAKVMHNGTTIYPKSAENVEGYIYENGYVTFYTNHFSPFTVIFNEGKFAVDGVHYTTFEEAVSAANEAAKTKNVTLEVNKDVTLSGDLTIKPNSGSNRITLIGDGKITITNTANVTTQFVTIHNKVEIDGSIKASDSQLNALYTYLENDVTVTGDIGVTVYFGKTLTRESLVKVGGTISTSPYFEKKVTVESTKEGCRAIKTSSYSSSNGYRYTIDSETNPTYIVEITSNNDVYYSETIKTSTATTYHNKLLADYTISSYIKLYSLYSVCSLDIDLNGHNINSTVDFPFVMYANGSYKGSNLTITGEGTFDCNNKAYLAYIKGAENSTDTKSVNINIGKDVNIINSKYAFVINNNNNNSSYNVNIDFAGKISGYQPFYVSGNIHKTEENAPKINIKSTAEINCDSAGLYLAGYARTTIESGAKITNTTGNAITICAGELTVDGGTITSGSTYSIEQGTGGAVPIVKCCSIFVKQHGTNLPINVTINGGTFSAAIPVYQLTGENGEAAKPEDVSLVINGGTFTSTYEGEEIAKACVMSSDKTGFIKGGAYSVVPSSNLIASGYHWDETTKSVIPN